MTNGSGNVVKKIQLNQRDKPSEIIWVQFDHNDVGEKTRHENKHLYAQGIETTWTPIKPITTQYAVGRNQAAQVVRKQFPLRPATAKTIHCSQGDTDNDTMYEIDGYTSFRNDSQSPITSRPYGGMAVYSRVGFIPGYPRSLNIMGIKITIMKLMILPHVTIIAIY